MLNTNIIKILFLLAFSAILTVIWTPILTHFLYKHKLWRKFGKTESIDGRALPILNGLDKKRGVNIPRLGGALIWITTIFIAFLFSFLPNILKISWFEKINFLSRGQTWLPLGILLLASLLGLFDDILLIFQKGQCRGGGMRFTRRLLLVLAIGAIGAWWFYFKLGWHTLYIPGIGDLEIGFLYFPLFVLTVLSCWSGGIIDGLDGLAGGSFAIMFGAFTVIAFSQAQYDLAALCSVLVGTILAFLWFNIPPARFYMGESGIMGLTTTLAVVAFLTDSLIVLPIIGGLLVIESGSDIIQIASKKFFGKKVFLSAPIHHHLEAKGWSAEKITMRFWIIGMILAVIGVSIRLLG